MRKIKRLIVDWCYTPDGEGYVDYEVGKKGVVKIEEHTSKGNGDRWHYDVHFKDGRMNREFNVNSVEFEAKK